MPDIDDFNIYSREYLKKVMKASENALKHGSESGAEFMRLAIEGGSPTDTDWHIRVNKERNMSGGRVDSGAMLRAVGVTQTAINNQKISINFGWVKNQQQYFLDQDTGGYKNSAYGNPSGIGMGLLNRAEDGGGNETIRLLGAYYSAASEFTQAMKRAGFRETDGNGGELF